jgi:hypothetical protein
VSARKYDINVQAISEVVLRRVDDSMDGIVVRSLAVKGFISQHLIYIQTVLYPLVN